MEKKGYRIAHYERNLPAGAVIDEVRYRANGGQRRMRTQTTSEIILVRHG